MRGGKPSMEITDYLMAEKFGLGWKDADMERMHGFIVIMDELGKKANGQAPANAPKFRPRMG